MTHGIRNPIRLSTATAGALLLAGVWSPAFAQPVSQLQSQGPAATAASATPAEPRRICVRMEMTGSRLTRNICRTVAEWERAGGVPTSDNQ